MVKVKFMHHTLNIWQFVDQCQQSPIDLEIIPTGNVSIHARTGPIGLGLPIDVIGVVIIETGQASAAGFILTMAFRTIFTGNTFGKAFRTGLSAKRFHGEFVAIL